MLPILDMSKTCAGIKEGKTYVSQGQGPRVSHIQGMHKTLLTERRIIYQHQNHRVNSRAAPICVDVWEGRYDVLSPSDEQHQQKRGERSL